MEVTTEDIKKLRAHTGLSVMDCKNALVQTEGDMEKALIVLRKKSSSAAAKKSERTLGAGVVQAYVHASLDVGALVLLSCETDFVAKNAEFIALARNIAMHATATNPKFISRTQVKEEDIAKARQLFEDEAKEKPADKREAIVEGKLNSYLEEQVLLEQQYIKDPSLTITNLVEQATQKFGERIEISEYTRFSVNR
ncbi:TPA: elongation factor Ts [Patescibacteria group bacterium]|nr:MAG: Elongation factor Ts [Parcubacteria group bacterium GW2011_GWD2_42_14]HCC04966.1 elongation factor Ts [Patescibacteria group bacterium]